MRRTSSIVAVALVVASLALSAQKPDPDAQKLADQYSGAFNKADAKGIAALYTAEGTRVGPDGTFLVGRAAIEKSYATAFAAQEKKPQLSLQMGQTQTVAPGVKVMEGRYTIAGPLTAKGRFVNTAVKQGAGWLLASVVTIPDPPGAK